MPSLGWRVASLSLSLASAKLTVYLLAVVAPQLERQFSIGAAAFGSLSAVSFVVWSVAAPAR